MIHALLEYEQAFSRMGIPPPDAAIVKQAIEQYHGFRKTEPLAVLDNMDAFVKLLTAIYGKGHRFDMVSPEMVRRIAEVTVRHTVAWPIPEDLKLPRRISG